MKSGTPLSQVASRTMPHEVKSTHALHSHYKYKHLSWGKYDEEKKRPDLRLDNVFGSYQAGVSPEGRLEVGRTF